MKKYCEANYQTQRRPTRTVMVGNVSVGGDNPIRIQSMTTSNTRDVNATVEQIIRLADAGCEIARITVQGMKEADSCEQIKNLLLQRGYTIPLVADIHFYPPAALRVVEFVDKVRINPGNFVDKRASFKLIEYDDESYALELLKIEERFVPLIEKCRKLGRSMRIGTNHGSLSDRIMNRYGDTPMGMVESALEFTRICRANDYHDLIFSMKASNPQVMIQAYRLLAAEMYRLNWDYPLHLGVTEAGDGEDGRIKSAIGIGGLLLDGLGDTVRVSLTEDPWLEVEPCRQIVALAKRAQGSGIAPFTETFRSIEIPSRRPPAPASAAAAMPLPLHRDGSVWLVARPDELESSQKFFQDIGCRIELGRPKLQRHSVDAIVLREDSITAEQGRVVQQLLHAGIGVVAAPKIYNQLEAQAGLSQLIAPSFAIVEDESEESWLALIRAAPALILLRPRASRMHVARKFIQWLQQSRLDVPVLLNFYYDCPADELAIQAGAECGALLCDGIGEGLMLEGHYPQEVLRHLSFNILQAARMRTVKTEFISCPSCGRTLFDLQQVTRRIKERTHHLAGVKIAIMGCIVNGPGEMADADFGYVGSKPGKIDLYVGKSCVERDIDFNEADDRLVALIKGYGRWEEPEK